MGYIRSGSPGMPIPGRAAPSGSSNFPGYQRQIYGPTTPKMPMDEEANAQPHKGMPSLQKRRQVARRLPEEAPQGRQSPASSLHRDRLPPLPCLKSLQATRSRHAQTDSVARCEALPCNRVVLQEKTPPREAAASAAQLQGPASTGCKLPPLPAAPSASPAGGWEMASRTAASSRQPVPPPREICSEWGRAARLRTVRPATHSPAANTAAVRDAACCITNEVLGKVFPASQEPSQQAAALWDLAHSRAMAIRTTTEDVLTASDIKAPTALPTPESCEPWGTSAASRASTSASPARDTGSGRWGRDTPHDPARSALRVRCYLNERLLWTHHRSFAEGPSILSIKMEPLEELERSFPTPTGPSQDQLRNDILQWKRDSPEEMPGALAKEEECKDHRDEELSLWEDNNMHISVNPSVPELFQDPSLGPQERPSCPSSLDTEEADLQRESPLPATYRSPLPPATQEEACPVFGEQEPESESQEALPYTPPDYEDEALQDAALSVVREAVINALLITQRKREQRMGAATTAPPPAGPQDTESPLTGEAQGEATTAPLVPAADEHASDEALQDTSLYIVTEVVGKAVLVTQQDRPQSTENTTPAAPPAKPRDTASPLAEEASTAPLALSSEKKGDAATSPVAQDLPHQVSCESREEAQPSCDLRDVPEDVPGIATLLCTPAQKRQPSLFHRILRALRRGFRCSCIMGQKEE